MCAHAPSFPVNRAWLLLFILCFLDRFHFYHSIFDLQAFVYYFFLFIFFLVFRFGSFHFVVYLVCCLFFTPILHIRFVYVRPHVCPMQITTNPLIVGIDSPKYTQIKYIAKKRNFFDRSIIHSRCFWCLHFSLLFYDIFAIFWYN